MMKNKPDEGAWQAIATLYETATRAEDAAFLKADVKDEARYSGYQEGIVAAVASLTGNDEQDVMAQLVETLD